MIQLELIYNILKEWDSNLDLDEVECLLANLIHIGLVRGYISHESRLMVLSKQGAFPLTS